MTMIVFRLFFRILFVLGSLSGIVLQQAQASMRSEIVVFNTVTMSDQQLLRGSGGNTAGIAGALKLPNPDNNPAVILLYGPGGYTYELQDWVSLLNDRGIATFMVESTNGRVESASGMRQLSLIRDAYASLKVLAEHPAIDPKRIALIGFTDAGQAALYSGMERMKQLYGDPRYQFSAIAAFYPNCNVQYREDDKLIDAPIRVFHGENDNIHNINYCRSYVSRAASQGADISLTAFAGAEHAFDLRHPDRIKDRTPISMRDCQIEESVKGILINQSNGRLFRLTHDCVKSDGRWQYDADAAETVKVRLPAFIEQAFGAAVTAGR